MRPRRRIHDGFVKRDGPRTFGVGLARALGTLGASGKLGALARRGALGRPGALDSVRASGRLHGSDRLHRSSWLHAAGWLRAAGSVHTAGWLRTAGRLHARGALAVSVAIAIALAIAVALVAASPTPSPATRSAFWSLQPLAASSDPPPRAARTAAIATEPRFRDVAPETGLTFVHDNGGRGDYYLPEIMGSGAALFDYDNDGDLDVFLVQGRPLAATRGPAASAPAPADATSATGAATAARGETDARPGQTAARAAPAAASSTSRLFRNDLEVDSSGGRRLRFTDVTATAGVALDAVGMGTAVGDIDGDGYLDLYVTAFGSNALFRNNGNGTFTDVTKTAGVDDPRWSTSAAFLDYDRDADLDLFVVNYVDFTVAGHKRCTEPLGAQDYCAPSVYRPMPARLFRNDGRGRFANVSDSAGIARAHGAGLGVAVGDYNGDGWLDVYVANDATPNQLWVNQRDGTFLDDGPLSGSAVNAEGRPEGSMGIASGDYDADGDEDLLVTNLTRETFALYENDGAGTFEDRRARAGIAAPTAEMTGFGTGWFDYDHDGWLDLFATNGAVTIIPAQRGQPMPYRQRHQLFRGVGEGRLQEVAKDAAGPWTPTEIGRAAAFGDLDNDGDVDILVTNNHGPARLLRNDTPHDGRHWLQVRLDQPGGNRLAFGARVGITRRGQATLWRRVGTDGSYLSASDPRLHVGLGASAQIDAVVVHWPDGGQESWTTPAVDRAITLRRGTGTAATARQP